jgi:hypothetical protein
VNTAHLLHVSSFTYLVQVLKLMTEKLALKCFLIRSLTAAEPTQLECTVWTIITMCYTGNCGSLLPDYLSSIAGRDRNVSPSLGFTQPPLQ